VLLQGIIYSLVGIQLSFQCVVVFVCFVIPVFSYFVHLEVWQCVYVFLKSSCNGFEMYL